MLNIQSHKFKHKLKLYDANFKWHLQHVDCFAYTVYITETVAQVSWNMSRHDSDMRKTNRMDDYNCNMQTHVRVYKEIKNKKMNKQK